MVRTIGALALFLVVAPSAAAQAGRPFVELGVGTLAPNDPFVVTMAFRATAGWELGGQNAIVVEYSRQSVNRARGSDFGKYSRQLVGLTWQHALHDVFSDPEPKKLQYLVRLGGGTVVRGTFLEAADDDDLRNAPFVDVGLVIRYPLSRRFAAIGTVEDAVAFLPAETVRSYCAMQNGQMLCYPNPGPDFYTVDRPASTQHNLGVVLSMQLRL